MFIMSINRCRSWVYQNESFSIRWECISSGSLGSTGMTEYCPYLDVIWGTSSMGWITFTNTSNFHTHVWERRLSYVRMKPGKGWRCTIGASEEDSCTTQWDKFERYETFGVVRVPKIHVLFEPGKCNNTTHVAIVQNSKRTCIPVTMTTPLIKNQVSNAVFHKNQIKKL